MLVLLASFYFVWFCSDAVEEVGQVARRISGGRPGTIVRVWRLTIVQVDLRYCPSYLQCEQGSAHLLEDALA